MVLLLYFISALLEWQAMIEVLRWVGIVVAVAVAVYTAFLLSKSKGRDLWQNPLLVLVFLAHAVVAGSATLLVVSSFVDLDSGGVTRLQLSLVISLAVFLALALGELLNLHPTPQAHNRGPEHVAGPVSSLLLGRDFFSGALSPWYLPALHWRTDQSGHI